MLEMHVEQSIVLEGLGLSVGIVNGIAEMRQFEIKVLGRANHAGATPMRYRQDALAGVAEAIVRTELLTAQHSSKNAVATVGSILCAPNATNVIPGEVVFSLEVRDLDRSRNFPTRF